MTTTHISCPNCDRTKRWCIDCVCRAQFGAVAVALAQERARVVAELRADAEKSRMRAAAAAGWRQTVHEQVAMALEDFANRLEAEPAIAPTTLDLFVARMRAAPQPSDYRDETRLIERLCTATSALIALTQRQRHEGGQAPRILEETVRIAGLAAGIADVCGALEPAKTR